MPWQEVSTMLLREEFVMLARADQANRAQLCRRFGISRKTGYKWLERASAGYALAGAHHGGFGGGHRGAAR
jgi:transposase-like protein